MFIPDVEVTREVGWEPKGSKVDWGKKPGKQVSSCEEKVVEDSG